MMFQLTQKKYFIPFYMVMFSKTRKEMKFPMENNHCNYVTMKISEFTSVHIFISGN